MLFTKLFYNEPCDTKISVYVVNEVFVYFQHTDLSQYLEKHPGGLNTYNVKVSSVNKYCVIKHKKMIKANLAICC